MSEWTTSDGKIATAAFGNWADVETFRQAQEAVWNALDLEELTRGARAVVEKNRRALNELRRSHQNLRNQGQPYSSGVHLLGNSFDAVTGGVLSAAIFDDELYLDIENAISPSAALFQFGFRRELVSLGDARDRDDLLGALWEIAPGLQSTERLADHLKRERENTRETLKRATAKSRLEDMDRQREWEDRVTEARESYLGWARRRSKRWAERTSHWEARHLASEQRIKAVEETYREHMGLKAPVEYWQTKATQHETAEGWARLWVLIFFPVALIGMALAFNNTGVSLIKAAQAAQVPGAAPFPTAIFIVASAGLASCAGLVFWVGRLLTKLYLSQHHLRQDAQERATMTQTYLALIENSAASVEDRQVILNALFRNTPDGIVKEDGGLDPSIAAALGKFLAK
jgi:hypothetical protein